MTTDLDTRLRDSLHEHVHAVTPPVPALDRVLHEGRRRRARRAGAASALGVVAVAAAGVLLLGVLRPGPGSGDGGLTAPSGGPAIAAGGATGPEPVPGPRGLFVTRDRVYVDGSSYAVRLPWDTGAHVGRLGVAYPDPRTHRPSLLTAGGTVRTLATAPRFPSAHFDPWVAADGNGTLVAWAEQDGHASEVVAYDTRTRSVVARTTVRCHGSGVATYCPRPYVISDGMVFLSVYGGVRVWDPATGDLPGPLLGAGVSQAHHRVLTTFEDRGTVPVDRVGPGWVQARSPKGVEGILSYDGGWILDNAGKPTVVSWRDPSQTITYDPPGHVVAATFDTDGSALVVTRDSGRWTGWDCRLGGRCHTVVPARAREIRLVAWDL